MRGNVSEWVLDCGDDAEALPPAHGGARLEPDCSSRIRRGRSWSEPLPNAGATVRTTGLRDLRAADLGFRVAATTE